MRTIDDRERRFRLARQGLAESSRFDDPLSATTAMTVLHATEAPTVYLSLWARVPGLKVDDIDAALYESRSLVKQLAMRRTLFVFPRHLLPAAWGSASARGASMTEARLAEGDRTGRFVLRRSRLYRRRPPSCGQALGRWGAALGPGSACRAPRIERTGGDGAGQEMGR